MRTPTDTGLTFPEVEALMQLDPGDYESRVINLFLTHRATPEQYFAMAEAVRRLSESGDGDVVACIDRAVLPACPLCGWYCGTFHEATGEREEAS